MWPVRVLAVLQQVQEVLAEVPELEERALASLEVFERTEHLSIFKQSTELKSPHTVQSEPMRVSLFQVS